MSYQSETRLANNVRTRSVPRTVHRISMRSLLIAALILAVLCGVAIAAITWSTRNYLTYTDEDGQAYANEDLIGLAQPVFKTFEGDALRINVVDAIFDGRSLVLTWTMQNKQIEGDLYLIMENPQDDEPWIRGQGSQFNVSELFIHPGEVVSSGLSTLIDSPFDSDALPVVFSYAVLSPTGEVVPIGGLDETAGSNDGYEVYRQRIDDLNAAGKLVLAPDGMIELGSILPENADDIGSYAELLVAAGKMKLVENVEISFTLENNAGGENLQTYGQPIAVDTIGEDSKEHVLKQGSHGLLYLDKPIERDNGAYILRVVTAELTANSATFEMERVFETKEDMERFAPYYSKKLGPHWGFRIQDEENSNWFDNGSGSGPDAPVLAEDGTWVWTYEVTLTLLQKTPKTMTIIPCRDDIKTGANAIPYPEEAIVIQVP